VREARPPFTLEALDRQTDGNRALRFDVVRMFLDDCPAYVEAVHAAVRDGDAARLRSTAHKLKGAAGYLTAAVVADAAGHLETLGREGRLDEAVTGLERLDAAVAQLIPELRKVEP
jgi:two-component system, sensor histidine kinase and response regulator